MGMWIPSARFSLTLLRNGRRFDRRSVTGLGRRGLRNIWPCSIGYDLDAALPKSDVVMMLRIQLERMNAAFFPSVREYSRRYGLDSARMAQLPERAIVMHPGPMNRGVEIAAGVADSPRSTVVEQVANGVSVRMAVLYLLLGGAEAGQ